jgi:hypothetical protein
MDRVSPVQAHIKEFDAFLLVVDGVPWGGAFPSIFSHPASNARYPDRKWPQ